MLEWNDDFVEQHRRAVRDALETFGQKCVEAIRAKLSTQGPDRSTPGDSPHTQIGRLINDIQYRVTDDLQLLVGFTLDYGVYLEMGTQHMATRPFLVGTVESMLTELVNEVAILTA